ncbi:RagB/SusD family nutrient uptake outer membrane protein [Bacteroides sp. 224]|uniref:RagB/SusD family nutrient uptake outer membrane protein n=1 Tax=Bacteroides sp. 224 TaxID=2302936 RepID=UPI0013D4C99C|nr:RagB/SusD family nutrient uptake outer membrane protein [Bacteroides sp. 224]NDV65344.1 RagB/SusD family nutrient uptake outer membrane protein [Bacteroides sp. 224]
MKKILYIFIMAGSILMSSCSDWLDILPKNEQVTENYWKTKEDVEAVLTSGYINMRTTTPFLIDWGELRGASIYAYNNVDKRKLQDFQITDDSSLCKWNAFYKVLNMANSVIKYAPGVAEIDETYAEVAMRSHQTEAYFMRALMYFYLVRNFKEVPLVLEPYIDDSAPYSIAKSSEEAIIAQIKEDVKTALSFNAAKEFFDHENWSGASKGRATVWALYALMAETCLWSGDYDECIKYADYLINATAPKRPVFMSIPEQWFTIFNPGNSNESIFEMNWDYTTFGQTANSPANYFTISSAAPYQYGELMLERLQEDRLLALLNGETIRSFFGAYVTVTDGTDNFSVIWKYRGTDIRDALALRVNGDANYIIYRMADVMLMKAEALIWKGESTWQDALDIMNQIRVRSNLSELSIAVEDEDEWSMLEYLLYERDIELAAEGKRWYDLLRVSKAKDGIHKDKCIGIVMENNTSANDSWIRSVLKNTYAWYLPIHENEIKINQLLEQNPYYKTTN